MVKANELFWGRNRNPHKQGTTSTPEYKPSKTVDELSVLQRRHIRRSEWHGDRLKLNQIEANDEDARLSRRAKELAAFRHKQLAIKSPAYRKLDRVLAKEASRTTALSRRNVDLDLGDLVVRSGDWSSLHVADRWTAFERIRAFVDTAARRDGWGIELDDGEPLFEVRQPDSLDEAKIALGLH